jgi:hypothetical protein
MKIKEFLKKLESDQSLKYDFKLMLVSAFTACERQVYLELNGKRYFSSADIQRVGTMAARKVLNLLFLSQVGPENSILIERFLVTVKSECYMAYRDNIEICYLDAYKHIRNETKNKRLLRTDMVAVSNLAANLLLNKMLTKTSFFKEVLCLITRALHWFIG